MSWRKVLQKAKSVDVACLNFYASISYGSVWKRYEHTPAAYDVGNLLWFGDGWVDYVVHMYVCVRVYTSVCERGSE